VTTRPTDVPVVIVGAGPVGLVAAILLARRGIRSLILERFPRPYPLPRAVHVDDEVLRILQQVGISDAFTAVSRPAAGLRLVAADRRVIAEFRRDQPVGRHGHAPSTLFDQPDLDHLLRTELARHPQAELRTGIEVTGFTAHPGHVQVHHRPYREPRPGDQAPDLPSDPVSPMPTRPRSALPVRALPGLVSPVPALPVPVDPAVVVPVPRSDRGSVTASAVIGCDGADSTVRGYVGAGLDDLGFTERWLVVDGRSTVALDVWDGVDQICDPRRAATVMRIGADRYRWEFRLHATETITEMSTPQRLSELLRPWTGSHPDAVQILRAAEYTFRARLADRWRRGPVFLAGDAAHLTPPFVGQGLGSGLRDVHNLTWKLALVLNPDHPQDGQPQDRQPQDRQPRDENPWDDKQGDDERLLDSYQQERRPHARSLIRLAVLTGWAMTGGQDAAATTRRVVLSGFCRLPGATGLILDRIGPPLTPGPFVHRTPRLLAAGGRPHSERDRWPLLRRPLLRRPLRALRDPAGTLVPQPWVHTATGRHRLDDVLGPGFALLANGPLDPDLADLAHRLHLPVLQLRPTPPGAPAPSPGEILVHSPDLLTWMRTHRTGAVLLRPDRVVLAAAPAARPGERVGAALVTVGRTTIRSHWAALLRPHRTLG